MHNPIVIIHGWNDTKSSFTRLKNKIKSKITDDTLSINLGNWISREDDVTYDDLADALQRAWKSQGLPTDKNKVDVIVHSTGSLVVRHWLIKFYPPEAPPIKRFIQLAPANFGSPLAHIGRLAVSRARNGFTKEFGNFETGKHLLKGLELGSPYSWELAEQDRFGEHSKMYELGESGGGIQCSVLVGNEGNLAFVTEFDGSDGTVRTSTANMNCRKMVATLQVEDEGNFSGVKPKQVTFSPIQSRGDAAFKIYDGLNHGNASLSQKAYSKANQTVRDSMNLLLDDVVKALQFSDDEFRLWQVQCAESTRLLAEACNQHADDEKHGHQNTVVRVVDYHGKTPDEYYLEIYDDDDFDEEGELIGNRSSNTRAFNRYVVDDLHEYQDDKGYKCFHISCTMFRAKVLPNIENDLRISVSALPEIKEHKRGNDNKVGYRSSIDADIGHISIPAANLDQLFIDHTTFLLELRIVRTQSSKVFEWV